MSRKPKFVVYKDVDGDWYFYLVSSNGRVICQSEGYLRKKGALKGIEFVKKNARKASVVLDTAIGSGYL